MLYYAVAAFFLLPASVVFFGRGWFRALRLSPWYLFGQTAKIGPQRICRQGALFNLFVFYPMRAGIEILRRRSFAFVFRAAAGLARRRLRGEQDAPPPANIIPEVSGPGPLPPLSAAALIRMVERDDTRVVSFDIFDTLLTRPVLNDPREILHLVAMRVNERFGIDFAALRWPAEDEMRDPYATFEDIYAHIRRRHGLSEELTRELMAEELRCERAILRPRPDMLEVCRAAARAGKRVVAVSDMYLPSAFLLELLHEKGFEAVAAVYVSAEHKARKTDDSALFDVMLRAENVSPDTVLHMGDNPQGDVNAPLRKGMRAVHLPSARQMAVERGGSMLPVLFGGSQSRPLWELLMGQALERIFDKPEQAPETLERCPDTVMLARLILAPLTVSLCLRARAVAEREGYARIYYASRDGWLPSLVHDALRERLGGPEGVYFQAGRRAYFPFQESSFMEYARTRKVAADMERYTLADLLTGHFGDEAAPLLERLAPEERALPFCKERQRGLAVLARLEPELEQLAAARRERARRYYEKVFSAEEQRVLVFDVGYSGSVSAALTVAAGRPVDKLYCWQNEVNAALDRRLGTRTFALMGSSPYMPWHIVFEEMFSPCSGGAVDFDEHGEPLTEALAFSPEMRAALEDAHEECLAFARETAERFGEYAPLLAGADPDGVLTLLRQWFQTVPLGNRAIFRSIVFPDPVYSERPRSLEEQLDQLPEPTVFAATGFEDAANILPLTSLCRSGETPRTGVHMHIYNVALAQAFARYAAAFPCPFDLFVTYVKSGDAPQLRTLFDPRNLPQAGKVRILETPNRGRDVAPWLVALGPLQGDYDLFCHVHAKESAHMGFGPSWRTYLMDNLLRPEAARTVFAAFAADPRLGCVFPAIYEPLRRVMLRVGVPLYGSREERDMITGLLARMGLPASYGRDEQFFSGGTMMWYRPEALRPLLECGLRFEDFPEEPIGIGGTLAHALERVPPLVCTRRGYGVRSLTCYPSFLYPERGN